MNRFDRLMGIITQLQSRKHITLQQIAEQFRISECTVFRDLKAISEKSESNALEKGLIFYLKQYPSVENTFN
jgi:DeoR/GlpR family transcriptional regulator of sugar metabolism